MIKKEIRDKVLAAFKKEYKTHLEGIREILAGRNGETLTPEASEKARIRAHTLKGAAKAADLPPVQTMAISLETIFTRIKNKELTLNPLCLSIIDTLLDTVDSYIISAVDDTTPPREQEAQTAIREAHRFLGLESREPKTIPPKAAPPGAVSMEKIRQKVFMAFQQEYRTHLENLRNLAASMGKAQSLTPHDINEAFRAAHTLKGAARAADIPTVQTLAHDMETLFSRIKEKKLSLNKEVKTSIETSLDAIEDYVEALRETGGTGRLPEPAAALKRLNDLLGVETSTAAPAAETEPEPTTGETPEEFPQNREPGETPTTPQFIDTLRIKTESLERIRKTAGQILAENQRHRQLTEQIRSMEALLGEMTDAWRYVFKTSHHQLRRMEADPDLSKIAGYINIINHHAQRLGKNLRGLKETQKNLDQAGQYLGQQLQKNIQYARMVPAESVFQAFRKMVRDIARDEGKSVEIQITGLEIQADRMVFQGLKDPIMHLLRNAVSHGIELPSQRRLSGKEETGRIDFHIEIKGSRLCITIEDDGRGIDVNHIANTAVKKGLLSKEHAETADPGEIINFIFHPGFSTAREVTDLYGRGMGLSVVKETLHRLQGDIDIRSEPHKGTRLTLLVPLTIMTHRLLLVKVDGQVFGVPASGISRLLHLDRRDIETLEKKPVIHFNGRHIPLFTLEYILEMGEPTLSLHGQRVPVMVIKSGDMNYYAATAVQEFIGEEDIIIQELPPPLNRHPYYYGGCTRVDGTVTLVLNPSHLVETIKAWEKKTIPITLKTGEDVKPTLKKARILIVDDSITTRTLEKTILDAHGYDVYVSVDGMEALQFLQLNEVDLVITDVAMPRMTGFQLVEEMKKHKRLKTLPVIIVSSLDRKEDREKGLALGADAYIVKQKFEQQNLLETIRQII